MRESLNQTVLTRTFWRWGGSLQTAAVPEDADATPALLRRDRACTSAAASEDEFR